MLTEQECIDAAMAELVRSWYDQHPIPVAHAA